MRRTVAGPDARISGRLGGGDTPPTSTRPGKAQKPLAQGATARHARLKTEANSSYTLDTAWNLADQALSFSKIMKHAGCQSA